MTLYVARIRDVDTRANAAGIYIDIVLYITKQHIQEATILSVISV
jgi:hypothetical protein